MPMFSPPSFARFATITAMVSVVAGLGVVGAYVKNTGTGQSAARDLYCWKSSSGSGLCINENGGIRGSGSITTQTALLGSGSTTYTAGQGLTLSAAKSFKTNAAQTGTTLIETTSISGATLYVGGAQQIKKVTSTTTTLDFGNLASIGCEVLTVSVPGAAAGDSVFLGVPDASNVTNGQFTAWVSSANTVTIKFCTVISGDPASGSFRATVFTF